MPRSLNASAKIDAPHPIARHMNNFDLGLAQARGSHFGGTLASDDERRNLGGRHGKTRGGRQPEFAVEHDAQGLTVFETGKPHSQQGIIRENRADARHHRVVHGPHDVNEPVRGCPRDHETRLTRRRRRIKIRRQGEFQGDHRPPVGHPQEMSELGPPRLLREDPRLTSIPAPAKMGAAPADAGIGIVNRIDHAPHPGRDNRIGARRRPPMMTARLQSHVKRRAARLRSRLTQGFGFRMRTAAGLGPAARQNGAVFDNERADGRIWGATPKSAPAERESRGHEPLVRIRTGS